MEAKRKTIEEIVDETVLIYSNPANRSVTKNKEGRIMGCLNNGPNGTHCAFARLVKPELRPTMGEGGLDSTLLNIARAQSKELHSIDEILIPEYAGYGLNFYRSLQSLHDTADYWTDTGLSAKGEEHVKSLKAIFK